MNRQAIINRSKVQARRQVLVCLCALKARDSRGVRGHAPPGNFEKLSRLRLHFVCFEGCYIENQTVKIKRKIKHQCLRKMSGSKWIWANNLSVVCHAQAPLNASGQTNLSLRPD